MLWICISRCTTYRINRQQAIRNRSHLNPLFYPSIAESPNLREHHLLVRLRPIPSLSSDLVDSVVVGFGGGSLFGGSGSWRSSDSKVVLLIPLASDAPPLPYPLDIDPDQLPDQFLHPLIPIITVHGKNEKPGMGQLYLLTFTTITFTHKLAIPRTSTENPISSTGSGAEWCFALIQDTIPTTMAWNAKADTSNPECTVES